MLAPGAATGPALVLRRAAEPVGRPRSRHRAHRGASPPPARRAVTGTRADHARRARVLLVGLRPRGVGPGRDGAGRHRARRAGPHPGRGRRRRRGALRHPASRSWSWIRPAGWRPCRTGRALRIEEDGTLVVELVISALAPRSTAVNASATASVSSPSGGMSARPPGSPLRSRRIPCGACVCGSTAMAPTDPPPAAHTKAAVPRVCIVAATRASGQTSRTGGSRRAVQVASTSAGRSPSWRRSSGPSTRSGSCALATLLA